MKPSFCCIFVSFSILLPIVSSDSGIEWQQPMEVVDYEEYKDVSFLQYNVPEQTKKAIWTFRAYTLDKSCKTETIFLECKFNCPTPFRPDNFGLGPCCHQSVFSYQIAEIGGKKYYYRYLRPQSLPVINPENETFPENFYLDRSNQLHLTIKSDNKSVELPVNGPTSGTWYGVVFIQDEETGMHPPGLMPTCTYKFTSKFRTMRQPLMESLVLYKTYSVNIDNSIMYRFYLDYTVMQFTVDISQCQINATEPCSLELFTASSVPDSSPANTSQSCSAFQCSLTFQSPSVAGWQYLLIKNTNIESSSLNFNISTQECHEGEAIEMATDIKSCSLQSKLDRFDTKFDFHVLFVEIKNDTVSSKLKFNVTNSSVLVVPFQLRPVVDIGGTLAVGVIMDKPALPENSTAENITVIACISRNHIPTTIQNKECGENNALIVSTPFKIGEVYIPYPKPGLWYISMVMVCFSNSSVIPCQTENIGVKLVAYTNLCVDGHCSGHGYCKEYVDNIVVYSTCQCAAGWRGYGCTDGTHAKSKAEQIESVLLLTLSNLFFIPAIVVAFCRGFYVEAFVYSYNCFFSTFYHACDGDIVYKYCITSWGVLSTCDFLGSLCSIWITIIAMARLKEPFPPILQIAAPLLILVGVLKNRRSTFLFLALFITGLVILCISWIYRCRRRKQCYPAKKTYLTRLLPGLSLAATGILLYAFAETDDNYKYIHSIWHVVMSLCIVFLLPLKKDGVKGMPCCRRRGEVEIENQDLLYQQRNASSTNEIECCTVRDEEDYQ